MFVCLLVCVLKQLIRNTLIYSFFTFFSGSGGGGEDWSTVRSHTHPSNHIDQCEIRGIKMANSHLTFCHQSNTVSRGELTEEFHGLFRRPLALRSRDVHVEETKALIESFRPLKVVQQGPAVVAPDVHSVLCDGCIIIIIITSSASLSSSPQSSTSSSSSPSSSLSSIFSF